MRQRYDHQHRAPLIVEHAFEQIETACVRPLEVIEEQCQRVLRSRDHLEEATACHRQSPPRLLGAQLLEPRRIGQQVRETRRQLDQRPGDGAEVLPQQRLPALARLLSLTEQVIGERVTQTCDARVGSALGRIEARRGEVATAVDDAALERERQRGLAHPALALDEH